MQNITERTTKTGGDCSARRFEEEFRILTSLPHELPHCSELDCAGTKWRHFAPADGTSFDNAAACIAYTKHKR